MSPGKQKASGCRPPPTVTPASVRAKSTPCVRQMSSYTDSGRAKRRGAPVKVIRAPAGCSRANGSSRRRVVPLSPQSATASGGKPPGTRPQIVAPVPSCRIAAPMARRQRRVARISALSGRSRRRVSPGVNAAAIRYRCATLLEAGKRTVPCGMPGVTVTRMAVPPPAPAVPATAAGRSPRSTPQSRAP